MEGVPFSKHSDESRTNASDVLKLIIDRHKLNGFVSGLALKPSSAGDHW